MAADCDVHETTIDTNLLSFYDYDDLGRVQKLRAYSAGNKVSTADYAHDALDRLMVQTEKRYNQTTPYDESQTKGRDTAFTYVGLTDLVAKEVRKDRTGASIATKTYSYDPFGRRVAMDNDSHDATRGGNDGVFTYSYDVHGNVSQLLDDAGNVKASYGYTPYGGEDPKLTTDSEQIKGSTGVTPTEDPFNSYRYSGFRFDNATGTIDMGFRRFGPDTSRFLSPDSYGGAMADLGLSMDPITGGNRYSLGAGNPVTYVEIDGHVQIDGGGCGGSSGCGKNPLTRSESQEIAATARANHQMTHGNSFVEDVRAAGRALEAWVDRQPPFSDVNVLVENPNPTMGDYVDASMAVAKAYAVERFMRGVGWAFRQARGAIGGVIRKATGGTSSVLPRGVTQAGTRELREQLSGSLRGLLRTQAGFADEGVPVIVDSNIAHLTKSLRARGINARSVPEIFDGMDPGDASIRQLANQLDGRILTKDVGRDVLSGGGLGDRAVIVPGQVRSVDSVLRLLNR